MNDVPTFDFYSTSWVNENGKVPAMARLDDVDVIHYKLFMQTC